MANSKGVDSGMRRRKSLNAETKPNYTETYCSFLIEYRQKIYI
jgi:hypothetical protein